MRMTSLVAISDLDSAQSPSSGTWDFVNFFNAGCLESMSRSHGRDDKYLKKRFGPETAVLFIITDASSISSTPKFERNEGPSWLG